MFTHASELSLGILPAVPSFNDGDRVYIYVYVSCSPLPLPHPLVLNSLVSSSFFFFFAGNVLKRLLKTHFGLVPW